MSIACTAPATGMVASSPADAMLHAPVFVHLRTYGCQMNVLDSEILRGLLAARGFVITADEQAADAVLFNTCSVRDMSERKVLGKLGMLTQARTRRPELVLGVLGCMAELNGDELLRRAPQLDFVCGTNQRQHVPDLLYQALCRRVAVAPVTRHNAAQLERLRLALNGHAPPEPQARIVIGLDAHSTVDERIAVRLQPWRAYVEIMRGCSNFCSYCVVPYARGPEVSRAADDIVAEVEQLVACGCRDVTLLGQNVNSYGKDHGEGSDAFPALLRRLDAIADLCWLRFVTSNPQDISDAMIGALAACKKVCPQIHFPLQSGSDRVLQRMHRRYRCADYLAHVARLRAAVPAMMFSSDFIVGFPGETDADFQATVVAMEQVRFASAFIFKYSPRPRTAAARDFPDDVPTAVKEARHQQLLALQNAHTLAHHQQQVGTRQLVLVDGPSKTNPAMLQGRSAQYFNIVFPGTAQLAGSFAEVCITHATPLTLYGEQLP
ncbi:MAG: MiaB/RimO family radical SAM methylthiotransferase [bacterium]|nr:MiaB/RimO family radical SAM methylthiotransferase [bacterium]